MQITLKEVKEEFNKWNEKAFGGELPLPSFELMRTKSLLGQFKWQRIGKGRIGYTIRISTYYDRPYDYYVDTIVHEMLHYYIKYKGIEDTSSHGKEWKHMAKQISDKFGLTITRTGKAGGGISKAVIDKKITSKTKHEYVIVCKLNNGRYGASVIPVNSLSWYTKIFMGWKLIITFKIVKAPWSKTYDLRHLRGGVSIQHIDKERFDELFSYQGININ